MSDGGGRNRTAANRLGAFILVYAASRTALKLQLAPLGDGGTHFAAYCQWAVVRFSDSILDVNIKWLTAAGISWVGCAPFSLPKPRQPIQMDGRTLFVLDHAHVLC